MPFPLSPEKLLKTLNKYSVEFIVIILFGAGIHGYTIRTGDIDICPAPDLDNLEKLALALEELEGRAVDPTILILDAYTLEHAGILQVFTKYGKLDISPKPSGTQGYGELVERAKTFSIWDTTVNVAAFEDIILTKITADRPKDRAALPGMRKFISRQIEAEKEKKNLEGEEIE